MAINAISINARICLIDLPGRRGIKTRKAICHGFFQEAHVVPPSLLKGGHSGGQVSSVFALVETEEGRVHRVAPDCIRFLDSKGIFEQYDWSDPEEAEA